VQGVDCD